MQPLEAKHGITPPTRLRLQVRLVIGCACVQVSWRTPGVYVPQLGDEVVYMQVGHRKFLFHNNNKLQGPWESIVSTLVSA